MVPVRAGMRIARREPRRSGRRADRKQEQTRDDAGSARSALRGRAGKFSLGLKTFSIILKQDLHHETPSK